MHTTDIQGIFSLLTVSEQSGLLTIQPDRQTPPWQAYFTLVQGQPTDCVVTASDMAPMRMEPRQAIAVLSQQGTLQWRLEPLSSEPAQRNQELQTPGAAFITMFLAQTRPGNTVGTTHTWQPADRPCRIQTGPHSAYEWRRLRRSIFGLIDGKRTVQEIAHILHKSLEDIEPLLQDLYQSGWIGKL